jgi:hypothetical protein
MRSLYGHDIWSDKQVEKYREKISEGIACIVTVFAFPLVTILMLYSVPRLPSPGARPIIRTMGLPQVQVCSHAAVGDAVKRFEDLLD